MNAASGCQVDEASLPFRSMSAYRSRVGGRDPSFQASGFPEMSYKPEDWRFSGPVAESDRALSLFKLDFSQVNAQCFYSSSEALLQSPFLAVPESPHSIGSASSQPETSAMRDVFFGNPTAEKSTTGHGSLSSSPESANLERCVGRTMYPRNGAQVRPPGPSPDDASLLSNFGSLSDEEERKMTGEEIWDYVSQSGGLEVSNVNPLSATGSSTYTLLDQGVGHDLGLEPPLLPGAVSCGQALARDPSVPLDSPLSHALSESIFDGFDMPEFDAPEQHTLTPTTSAPEEDFHMALDLPVRPLLQVSDIVEEAPLDSLASALPTAPETQPGSKHQRSSLRAQQHHAAGRGSRVVDSVFCGDLDLKVTGPRTQRKSQKVKRVAKASSRLDDYTDYQPHERKKTAITARGRKVNCLQLTEEDNCEEFTDSGNRRSKHHNPWTVEETEALVYGVESCGGGKWADIKKLGLRAIERRSAVDLKDKWRNLQAALYRTKSDKKREIPAGLLQRVKVLVPLTATKARGEGRAGAGRKQARHPRARQR